MGVCEEVLAAFETIVKLGVSPWSYNGYVTVEGVGRQLKPYLVIAFSSRTVGDVHSIMLFCHLYPCPA